MKDLAQVVVDDEAQQFSTEFASVLAVDGENIDGHLRELLGLRFKPELRPRWQRVREFVERIYGGPCKALFFLNASRVFPYPFAQAMRGAGFEVVGLKGTVQAQLVDDGIKRVLQAMRSRGAAVVVASHDGGFDGELGQLAANRQVSLIGFRESVSARYQGLLRAGKLHVFDLEDDVHAFDGGPLPRGLRAIALEDFDPEAVLKGVR